MAETTEKKKKRSRGKPLDAPRRQRSPVVAAGILACVLIAALLLGIFIPDGEKDAAAAFANQPVGESPVRLNEVMTSNLMTLFLPSGGQPDWVELKNTSRMSVSLGGYVLMRGDDATSMYRFPATEIPGGGTLLLYADDAAGSPGELHLPFKLASSGVALTLMNAAGEIVDRVEVPRLESDSAYCRTDEGDWRVSSVGTPGAANQFVEPGSTAARSREVPVQSDGSVVVTEVMTRNVTYVRDMSGEACDYIEVTNVSNGTVNLEGWRLSDDKMNLSKWVFPSVSLKAGECVLVYCTGMDKRDDPKDLHAGFRLSSDGESVILTSREGKTTSMVSVPALNPDQAYSFTGGRWTSDLAPTPGAANTLENAQSLGNDVLRESGSQVYISEICAAPSGDTPDWIELYNAGSEPVSLSDYELTDNPKNPGKWRFPSGMTLSPGQYTAVFCSGENKLKEGYQHTNFRLSAEGGYSVALSRTDGTIVDRVFLPCQYEGITYGRDDGQRLCFFASPSPLKRNEGVTYAGRADTAKYSVSGGMYKSGQALAVELTAQEGARIHYTLDCSDPTESSPLYTGPIPVTQTTILRTRVYAEGYMESFMDTQSYLYDVNNGNGVFVVSLVSDPENLTSQEKGIMIKGPNAAAKKPYKGANFWQDWEREAHVEIYGGDGGSVLSSECGIKLHGQYSRAEKQQAFKVIARTEYGDNRFHAALFSKRPYQEYQSFLLRSSGQDTGMTRMRDSVLTSLAAETSVMYQETEICVLYLDGQYWGHYNLRERINTASVCQFEGWEGQEDDIDLIKGNRAVKQGSNSTFAKLVEYAKKADPTTDEFYNNVSTILDMRNYIEYMALEIFSGNGDTLNVKRYRNVNADGKWRWVLFDLDWAFFVDTNSINRWLTPGGMGTNLYTDNSLFIACMKNPRFKDEFLTYMGEQMATTFSTENVMRLIDARSEILAPILPEQLERWGQSQKSYDNAMKKLTNYAKDRPLKLLKYFSTCQYLNLSTDDMYHYFGNALEVIQNYAGE